jgi:hypothetical protein
MGGAARGRKAENKERRGGNKGGGEKGNHERKSREMRGRERGDGWGKKVRRLMERRDGGGTLRGTEGTTWKTVQRGSAQEPRDWEDNAGAQVLGTGALTVRC